MAPMTQLVGRILRQPGAAKTPLPEIASRVTSLSADLSRTPPAAGELEALRHEYLTKQLQAMAARLRMLQGERLSFDEESRSARQPADWSQLPDEQLLRQQLREAVVTAIDELPEIYRAPVVLRDIQGLSTEEASSRLKLKDQTLKSRLHRGRLMLRERLQVFTTGLTLLDVSPNPLEVTVSIVESSPGPTAGPSPAP